MSPGGVTGRVVGFPLDRDGNLKLGHALSVNLLCNVLVQFPAVTRESQWVGGVGPTSPPVWHQLGHIGDLSRLPSTNVSTKKSGDLNGPRTFLALLRVGNYSQTFVPTRPRAFGDWLKGAR